MHPPKTQYARNGEVNIAYQVVGDGPIDLAVVPGFISHVDLWWTIPETTAFIRRLAAFSRLILFDKRGTGLSDPVAGLSSLEERMEDLHAVLDAAGSERPALLGISEGGPMSILFAGHLSRPGRVAAAVRNVSDREAGHRPLPAGARGRGRGQVRRADRDSSTSTGVRGWRSSGSRPTSRAARRMRRTWGLFERAAASPGMVAALLQLLSRDRRHPACCRRCACPRWSCTGRATRRSSRRGGAHDRRR